MSRVMNKIKSGFYASPVEQGEYISKLLDVQGEGNWLDTTCGEGAILAQLANAFPEHNIHTYGIEIDKARALKAKECLTETLHSAIEAAVVQNKAFSCCYLNPPYDHTMKGVDDNKADRKEYIELVRATKYLADGGLMIYTIPSYRFADEKISRFLASNFTSSGIVRYSNSDYDAFKQCVFFGNKVKESSIEPNPRLIEFLSSMDDEEFVKSKVTPINLLVGRHKFKVPEIQQKISKFFSRKDYKYSYYDSIKENKGFKFLVDTLKPKTVEIGGDPVLPVSQGQMALLLSTGLLNSMVGENDTLHLVQGLESVSQVEEQERELREDGTVRVITKIRTKRDVCIKYINAQGLVRKLV